MDNPSATPCPKCGSPHRADAPLGMCAACLWRGLDDLDEVLPPEEKRPDQEKAGLLPVPGHTVLAELARGGMGIVYRARQHAPAREVALKMLLPHQLGSSEMRARFQIEIRACAVLNHPAILPVYEVGESDGQPFFTMKLASGGTLAERAEAYRGRWRDIAELVATLADAVQFAHARGVLHRDLKPGNVLFDEEERPYLSDFGLAKFTQESDTTAFTRSLATLGTPHYLAPEVAAGGAKHATTASDLYALGAVFYELIAGRPPFIAESVHALLRKIAEEEPAGIKLSEPEIRRLKTSATDSASRGRASRAKTGVASLPPHDLDLIARKCLRKDPQARYTTASELADDLRRWLRGEAIHAKPVTRSAIFWAWSRRNPALASVSVLLVLALAVAAASQTVANYRLRMALGQALLNEARLTRNTGRAGQRFDTLALVRKANETAHGHWLYPALWRTEVIAALAQPDFRLIARWSVPAGHFQGGEEFSSNLSQYAAGSAGQTTIFDTATHQALQQFEGNSNTPAYGFRFSSDGRWFSIGYGDGSTAVWSLPAHQLWSQSGAVPGLPVVPEFLPDSSGILTRQRSDGIFLRNFLAKTSETALSPDAIPPAIPSPDGQYYLTRRRQSTGPAVWSRADGRLLSTGPVGMLGAEVPAWSPDSTSYATGQGTNPFTLSVVQALSGQTEAQFFDHELVARKIAFHPKGNSIASVGFDGRLVWRSLDEHGWKLQRDAAQRALQFSGDGRRLGFAPSAGELGLLELSPPEILHPWAKVKGDCDCAFTMDVSSDGRNLVTASRNTLRLWRTVSGELTDEFALPPKLNWANAVVAPDGKSVIASSVGWGVWRMDLTSMIESPEVLHFGAPVQLGKGTGLVLQEFAPDGRSLVVGEPWFDGGHGGPSTRIWLWPKANPTEARLLATGFPMVGLRLLSDGHTAFSTHWSEPDLWLWDTAATNRIRSLGLNLPVNSELSPDGYWLITATTAETIIWNTRHWTRAASWGGDARAVIPAFDRKGRTVATCDLQGRVTFHTVPAGEEIGTLIPTTPLRVMQIGFSRDGSKLWLLAITGRIWEWDLAGLRGELAPLGLDWK